MHTRAAGAPVTLALFAMRKVCGPVHCAKAIVNGEAGAGNRDVGAEVRQCLQGGLDRRRGDSGDGDWCRGLAEVSQA